MCAYRALSPFVNLTVPSSAQSSREHEGHNTTQNVYQQANNSQFVKFVARLLATWENMRQTVISAKLLNALQKKRGGGGMSSDIDAVARRTRRRAVEIAALLPEDRDEALAILLMSAEIVETFLFPPPPVRDGSAVVVRLKR
jgi:hypothetical protein